MDTVSNMALRIQNPDTLQKSNNKYPQFPINLKKYERIFQNANCIIYIDPLNKKCYKKSAHNKHELNILSEIKNLSNVINTYGIYSQLQNNIIYYVIEFPLYKMDLLNYMLKNLGNTKSKTNLTEEQIIHLIKQIISGINSLHNINIIHRDIKPENILIDEKGNIVITDFGNAESPIYKLEDNYGTEAYIPPEYYQYYIISPKYDIWSCGCILYTMLYSYMLWSSDYGGKCSDVIINNDITYYDTRSQHLINLCKMFLNKNHKQRATTSEILLHLNNIETNIKSDLAEQNPSNLADKIPTNIIADINLNIFFCNYVC